MTDRKNAFPYIIPCGLALQTASLSSDSWTELRLTSVARCSTKDPVFYEAGCRKLRWTDHQVARAGLWNVCYSFPKGIVPQMYFPTKPYCADFDDDVFPAAWLDDARFFCVLSPILATVGLVFYLIGRHTRRVYWMQTSSVLLVVTGISGCHGALLVLLHMNKHFLIHDRRARVRQITHWPLYSTVLGSLLLALMGLVGHIDKSALRRAPADRKAM